LPPLGWRSTCVNTTAPDVFFFHGIVSSVLVSFRRGNGVFPVVSAGGSLDSGTLWGFCIRLVRAFLFLFAARRALLRLGARFSLFCVHCHPSFQSSCADFIHGSLRLRA